MAASVSIIIPIHNVEAYLRQCLDSVVNQTLKDIEIVCVDDGSTDGSSTLLMQYAAVDSRMKVVRQSNQGTIIARKTAVAAARGEWCLFLDPDDWLEPTTCERLLHYGRNGSFDIVEYGVVVEEVFPRTSAEHKASDAYFSRPAEKVTADLMRRIFVDRSLPWNLIGKFVRMSLCKLAFGEQKAVNAINETDVYAMYHLVAHTDCLLVVEDRLYHYRYGIGISTKRQLTLAEFERILGKFDALKELEAFADQLFPAGSDGLAAVDAIGRLMTGTAFMTLTHRLVGDDAVRAGGKLLLGCCDKQRLVDVLIRKYEKIPHLLGRDLDSAGRLPELPKRRKVRHIGVYYHHLTIGGIQRVIEQEVAEFVRRGMRVTLFCDDIKHADAEISLPPGVDVVILPPLMGHDAAPPVKRAFILRSEIISRKIDVFHSHQYLPAAIVFDIVVCRLGCGIPFFLHYHNVCVTSIWTQPSIATWCHECCWLRLCDGVVSLSEMDHMVFAAEGVPSWFIPNPLPPLLVSVLKRKPCANNRRTVLWVGRLSVEKHPGDAIRVMATLKQADPALTFVYVAATGAVDIAEMRKLAGRLGVLDKIEMHTNAVDVYRFYDSASVVIMTSDYEGDPLVVTEALAHGVPVVSYAHPQICLFRGNTAVVQVKPRDVSAMAVAVRELMSRPDYHRLSVMARKSVRRFSVSGYCSRLLNVFEGKRFRSETSFSISNFSDFLVVQRRALENLHMRRSEQISALVKQRDSLREALERLSGNKS